MRLLTVSLLLLAAVAIAQPQTVTDADGTVRVINPETPLGGDVTVPLTELWRAGGDDPDLLIGAIADLTTAPDGRVYALDGQLSEVQVFAPDGAHEATLGRQGEGPGEFMNGSRLFWTPRGELAVLQGWPGKIVLLQTDGTPGPNYALPYDGGGFQIVSRGAAVADYLVLSGSAWAERDGQQMRLAYLRAYGMDGAPVAVYHEAQQPQAFGGFAFVERDYRDFQARWTAAVDGRVAAALDFDAYRIHVWNADGSLDRIIERPGYAPAPRSDEEHDAFQEAYDMMIQWNPGSTFAVSETHEAVTQLAFRDDGTLWVQSGNAQWRAGENEFTSYDVYDREGRFARRVHLAGGDDPVDDGVFLGDDRVYVVTDMLGSLLASFGLEPGEELAPVSIIAYKADLSGAVK
ncbi:MAG TPA: hypothetical protein P5571_04435 [Candidatus Krumholzibacteria bacterium]|nr:hypothetical protein [Candidatus Krumholzibacteria bacterium]HRX50588.1 hypothetical protein [Candidatus Krumholzibacteria bacterium]